jgi:hypothetical protein
MARGPCKFKQSEIMRAAKALRAAGYKSIRVAIQESGAEVIALDVGDPTPRQNQNALDKWMAKHARTS